MLTAYEQKLLASYLANIASGLKCTDPEARGLVDWFANRDKRLAGVPRRRRSKRDPDEEKISAERLRCVERTLQTERSANPARRDRTSLRLKRLGKSAGLNRTDLDILELLLRHKTHAAFESMVDDIFETPSKSKDALNLRSWAMPMILGLTTNTIQSRLRNDAPLVRSGLVSVEDAGDIDIPHRLTRLATAPGSASVDVTRLLLDAAPPPDLEWTDFKHFAADRDHIERLLKGALGSNEPGINILLYGPPGTGKTEFCKVLAARLGATLYGVGEVDEFGDEPSRRERLSELRLAQRLIRDNPRALLLFDELEDLLESSAAGGRFMRRRMFRSNGIASKVFLHRVLEQTPAPTLWTMNDKDEVSPAILRRMMFALELRPPTEAVRTRVWARQLERHGIEAAPEQVTTLAAEFDAAPGIAAGATAAASLAGGDIAAVHTGVRSLARLLSCDRPPQRSPVGFDPALIRADTDPEVLAARLASAGRQRFSLCLQGPSGTGKSAFVRYLAEKLGLEVMQKRASDLMSMWVGQTEEFIARAFAEARDAQAFLVFDEADSLLADRRLARRNWEVSQVNEMLSWMESHPLPFACTTNFGDRLDSAALRRFVFKITLGYLKPEQVDAAFRSHFDLPPPPSLAAVEALTPGDFAVVRNRAEILGLLQDPEAIGELLRDESAANPNRPHSIGFRASASPP